MPFGDTFGSKTGSRCADPLSATAVGGSASIQGTNATEERVLRDIDRLLYFQRDFNAAYRHL